MFLLIAVFLSLIMHRSSGGFLRFNNPEHITAPIDLEDLDPGSYDDLLKYNPNLGTPYKAISYGGDDGRNKAFDWSAPEIEAQNVMSLPLKVLPTKTKQDKADEFSLPFLVHQSGIKSNYILSKTNEQANASNTCNITDNKEVSWVREPSVRRSKSSRVKPKYRTYRITTPTNELTRHGYNSSTGSYVDHDYTLEGDFVSACYRCGELNYGKWWRPSVEKREREGKIIPKNNLCYKAFDDNWQIKTKARYLRSKCYDNEKQQFNYEIGYDYSYFYHECLHPPEAKFERIHTSDSGNPVDCFARYTGRCFKRFLDVGEEYVERGCASWPPHQSNSFASHRFTKMEYLLYGKEDACVSSPIASLTPFARGISLYVRYHVCVCTGKYCNVASDIAAMPLLLLFSSYIIIIISLY